MKENARDHARLRTSVGFPSDRCELNGDEGALKEAKESKKIYRNVEGAAEEVYMQSGCGLCTCTSALQSSAQQSVWTTMSLASAKRLSQGLKVTWYSKVHTICATEIQFHSVTFFLLLLLKG